MEFKPKLDTITAPYSGTEASMSEGKEWLQFSASQLFHYFKEPKWNTGSILKIWKASSTSKVSWYGIFTDLVLIQRSNYQYKGLPLIH